MALTSFNLSDVGVTSGPATGYGLSGPSTTTTNNNTSVPFIPDEFSLNQGVLGASTTYSPPPDPYAQWGGQTAYNNLLSGFNTQKDTIYDTSISDADRAYLTRKSSILDFIQGLKDAQQGIDWKATQNELAKKQAYSSITDMVGRGLRSGGTMLANRNASDSSAAEALARAYGNIGSRQLAAAGNQYALENKGIEMAQQQLGTQRATGLRKFEEDKTIKVNEIVTAAKRQLAALDADMTQADMAGRISIEQEKQRIREKVLDTLSQYDQELAAQAGAVAPSSVEDRRQEAFKLANAGYGAENPFSFTGEIPAEFQGTGPLANSLPIYTYPRFRREG